MAIHRAAVEGDALELELLFVGLRLLLVEGALLLCDDGIGPLWPKGLWTQPRAPEPDKLSVPLGGSDEPSGGMVLRPG